jgi:hypothetical protein
MAVNRGWNDPIEHLLARTDLVGFEFDLRGKSMPGNRLHPSRSADRSRWQMRPLALDQDSIVLSAIAA